MIHFYRKKKIFFIFSGILFLIGIAAIIINGVNLDIQFKGGAVLKYFYQGEINPDLVAEKAGNVLDRIVSASEIEDIATGEKRLVLSLAGEYGMESSEQGMLDAALKEEFPDAGLELSESSVVEPFFGKRFLRNGIIAIVLSCILIVLYVWFSFRKIGGLSAGVMALVALFHDLLIVFFTYVIFQIPIGDSFIAVALSILGYSINDTIVVYDRIRENSRIRDKMPLEDLVDLSISQSLTRSINTNICVTVAVAMIYIFAFGYGIDSIQSFALPMAVGSISGCYSTICIAGPLWVMWKKHKQNKIAA
ncbi:MAG: protein-export rane protein SecF [Clostridia bacterium]|nr:protein-export rane protein SecF [Clostridia bacterium]